MLGEVESLKLQVYVGSDPTIFENAICKMLCLNICAGFSTDALVLEHIH